MVELFSHYTDVFHWNIAANDYRFVGNQGGTSSSKTISILQVLCHVALSSQCVITVVGQDIPNLKKGSLRDFQTTILPDMHESFRHNFDNFNKSDRIYTLPNGSIIEFTSFSDYQDAKNGKRDYLFINEANGIPYTIAEQLISRTRKRIFFDWNPDSEFWYHEHIKTDKRCITFYSNFKHNPYIPEFIKEDIFHWKKTNERKYNIYGLGKTGKLDGLIYPNYNLVLDLPFIFDKEVYALDFGFSDPMSLNHLRAWNDQLFIDEIFYESFRTVAEMMKLVKIEKNIPIICDNARPESIKELRSLGFNAFAVEKGKGSVITGIEAVKKYKINVTVRSVNIKNEIKNYVRIYDKKLGRFIDDPVDENNHSMDCTRYGVDYFVHPERYKTAKTKYSGLV